MYIMGEKEAQAAARVIRSGSLFRYYGTDLHYHEADKLEKEFARRMGVRYALAVNSGTSALVVGLAGLGIGPGDLVMVPGFTFVATAAAVVAVGAVPIIVEVDETLTIDVADAERKLTDGVKAIIPVHMLGLPSNMERVMEFARIHGLKVLEDVAQATGGLYKGKPLGSIGDVGAFSLQWHKVITCGEGGMMITSDKETFDRARMFHDSAQKFRDRSVDPISLPGRNYRMSEISAAVARVQLSRLDEIVAGLRRGKRELLSRLKNLRSMRTLPSNDQEGDVGTTLVLVARSQKDAQRFSRLMKKPPYFSGGKDWHIYCFWDYILEKRSHHSSGFPFTYNDVTRSVNYSRDMCPRTLDILKRTFTFGLHPRMKREELDGLAETILRADRALAREVAPAYA